MNWHQNTHLKIIPVLFWNQWFDPKHTHSTIISIWSWNQLFDLKRALENESWFVLQSVIWPQTHTWRWFLPGFSNQWFVFNKHTWIWFLSRFVISVLTSKRAHKTDYCFALQSVIWPQNTHLTMILVWVVISFLTSKTRTWQWFLSCFALSDLTLNTHITMIFV